MMILILFLRIKLFVAFLAPLCGPGQATAAIAPENKHFHPKRRQSSSTGLQMHQGVKHEGKAPGPGGFGTGIWLGDERTTDKRPGAGPDCHLSTSPVLTL
jgi:hypothetical protein